MKNVFLILFMLGGLFTSEAFSQSCTPCPIKCCTMKAKPSMVASTDVNLLPAMVEVVAPCTPEQMEKCILEKICCTRDAKACNTALACKPASSSVSTCTSIAAPVDVAIDLTHLNQRKPVKG